MGAAFELPGVGLLAQTRRHAAQAPVLERPFERLARIFGAPAVADVEFQVVGALVAHHAARQVVAFDRFIGVQRVGFLHDTLHIGAYQHAGRRTSCHDERVASRAGSARQQAAVVGILHQTGREIVHDLGPCQPPEDVEVPLREPDAVEAVHVEFRRAVRIEFHAAQFHRVGRAFIHVFPTRVVGIPAVHVVDFVTPQQHVPQVGVEFDPLCLAAAFDGHAAQHFVPDGLRLAAYGVEIPSVELRFQVAHGVFQTRVRHADFEEHLAGLLQIEVEHHARLIARDGFRARHYALLVPAVGAREGPVALQHEE